MSDHLLLMSIGPVQEFIAQARRMRDLWFGSHVLSEVSMAAATALVDRGATLIFPALDAGDPRLQPCDELRHADGTPAYNVANKLLALVPGDPAPVAEHAEQQARQRLINWGLKTLEKRRALVDPAAHDSASEQLETLLRVQAVWTPWSADDEQAYEHAREELEAELAARKTLHAFSPWARQRGGVHKSSLDGARETVLLQSNRTGKAWQRHRIGLREQLDAVGLLKRAGGNPEQFVPIPTIGLAAWIEAAKRDRPDEFAALVSACEERKLPRVRRDEPWVQALPHDAQLLLPERWVPHLSEHGMGAEEAASFGRGHVQPLLARMREPYPYVACVVADGDRMGDAINILAKDGP
jgi:CRISPR-associated protein Cmr2